MLDNKQASAPTKPIMSRKRTRSRSEDSVITETKIQPLVGHCLPANFSEDPVPTKIRDECDYTQKITYQMAASGNAPRPVRVYADGAFDMFHPGHARVLKQAKNCFPNVYLIVGVCSDAMLHKMKGRTIVSEEDRYNMVRHCRYVDEVLRDAPWEYRDEFLEKYKIDFVAHDDIPYAAEGTDDIYAPLKEKGMFVATQRTEGVSTSDIVARIVRDYDVFARRNLAKGYSAKELNLSYLKAKKLKFKNKMDALKEKGKQIIDSISENRQEILRKWENRSNEIVDHFLLMFERRKLKEIWDESKEKIIKALTPPGSPRPGTSMEETDDEDEEPRAKIRRTS